DRRVHRIGTKRSDFKADQNRGRQNAGKPEVRYTNVSCNRTSWPRVKLSMQLSPLSHSKWNYTTAAHLANRAGFGGTPSEIEHLVKIGPDAAVDSFIDYEKVPDSNPQFAWVKTF